MRPRLVMLDGPCAGSGKSTLAESLVREIAALGVPAELFGEEQLFTRPEWTEVADGFRSKDFPIPEEFSRAYDETIGAAGARLSWLVFDWNCAGMAGDLPWAYVDPPALVRLCTDVRDIALRAGLDPVLLDLDVDARIATRRAMAERGPAWIERYDDLAVGLGIAGETPEDRIVGRVEALAGQRATELRALHAAGWPVVRLQATPPADVVLASAIRALGVRTDGRGRA